MNVEKLKRLLLYDPDTGIFVWRVHKAQRTPIGTIAGSRNVQGYLMIEIDGRGYRASRLAWLYTYGHFPKNQIDHINGIRGDDRLVNLREATHGQNMDNIGSKHDGLKGASFRSGKWQARITHNLKRISLGYFDTEQEAHEAYLQAAKQLKGDFAHE